MTTLQQTQDINVAIIHHQNRRNAIKKEISEHLHFIQANTDYQNASYLTETELEAQNASIQNLRQQETELQEIINHLTAQL